jgi:tRNA-specific 2-thiouridylase
MERKVRVAVAMSGGVDSSVAAALLKEEGFEVVGIYMHNWTGEWGSCDWDQNRKDALAVAMKLKIPFRVFDFEKEYRDEVIEYFFAEYAAGRTPNPDVECNRKIKFGLFLKTAREKEDVDKIATGHYARVVERPILDTRTGLGSRWKLLKGVDIQKDQSYFLWPLNQEQLSRTVFPVGEMTKVEVRQLARKLDLPVADKPDSQGICFVGEGDIRELLKTRLPEKPGKIVDTGGKVLGKHAGAYFFTIGQRRGLGIGGGIPYYVVKIDTPENIVQVAPINHPALYSRRAVVDRVNWISGQPPKLPLKCQVKIRYRQPDERAVLEEGGDRRQEAGSKERGTGVVVEFEDEQRAVTPGQSAVFYQGDEVLGGAVVRDRGAVS